MYTLLEGQLKFVKKWYSYAQCPVAKSTHNETESENIFTIFYTTLIHEQNTD